MDNDQHLPDHHMDYADYHLDYYDDHSSNWLVYRVDADDYRVEHIQYPLPSQFDHILHADYYKVVYDVDADDYHLDYLADRVHDRLHHL